jgi:hypothetical protein
LTQLVHTAEQGTPLRLPARNAWQSFCLLKILIACYPIKAVLKITAKFRRRWGIEMLDLNPDEVFQDVRDRSPGREVVL